MTSNGIPTRLARQPLKMRALYLFSLLTLTYAAAVKPTLPDLYEASVTELQVWNQAVLQCNPKLICIRMDSTQDISPA